MSAAAFFDLDRTLLQGGTGPMLTRAMVDLGLVSRGLPGQGLLYKAFDLFGETLPSIFLARQATIVARGREEGAFDAAALAAAEVIAQVIHPFAHALIEQHKAAGRTVVLATTTPRHLIAPLAERLGFDHVIATRYGVSEQGRFDGSISGPFVWSRGKLAAVRTFAEEQGIDLSVSYAYSDSIYDTPLLSAVGNPAAVNPDPRLTAYAIARRWPIVHFDVSPGVVKIPVIGIELQRLLFAVSRPELFPYVRFEVTGTEHIPRTGPAILAGNHRSYFDPAAMVMMMRRTGRTGRILAKRELFDLPVVGQLATALGGIRVDRGEGGKDSLDIAAAALEGGELVAVLPQGTIPRGERFFDARLRGKTGAARLAAMTRAPVIPFGIWGSEKVWPRSASMPNLLNLAHPPTVTVRVGPPVDLSYRSPVRDTERIMSAISALLPDGGVVAAPTAEQVRDATPGGKVEAGRSG